MVKIPILFILFFSIILPQISFSQGFQLSTAHESLETQVNAVHELKLLGSKYIRYPIYRNFRERLSVYTNNLKTILPLAKSLNIKVIVTMHNAWLANDYSTINYEQFQEDWREISYELKDYPAIFNIINEPKKRIGGVSTYRVYNKVAKIIRAHGKRRIMFASFGTNISSLKYFNPEKIKLNRGDIIEAHAYDFNNYLGYLKKVPTKQDFQAIESIIKEFKNKYKVRLLIGEVAFPANSNLCSRHFNKMLSSLDGSPFIIHAWKESEVWRYQDDCLNTILKYF